MDAEQAIVEYLKKEYSPRVIALAGSRAIGAEKEGSDWDLFLFCESDHPGGFFERDGQLLDLTFRDWPRPKDDVFTIPYGPVWPVKVLFDDTQGEFDAVLKRTKEVYDLGPLKAYAAGCAERLRKLDRWLGKIQKHEAEPEVQFYYAGYIFEFLIRIWFEQQNMWPQPPASAIPYIQGHDPEFGALLTAFIEVRGAELADVTKKIIHKLKQFGQ